MTDEPTVLGVRGGSSGLAASYERVRALADTYDAAGDRMRGWAGLGARTMTDDDLLESSILSPLTFAEAEAAVLAATTGPDGVLVESWGWETDAVLIRLTVEALETTDELVRTSFEVLDHATGRVLGWSVTAGAPLLLAGAAALAVAYAALPPAAQAEVREQGGRALQDLLTDHPELVQHVVNGGGGLLDGLWDGLTPGPVGGPLGLPSFHPDTGAAAGTLSALYPGPGAVEVRPLDVDVPGSGQQPGSLHDLVTHLAEVAGLSDDPDSPYNGTIQVETVTGPDGQVGHIVYLPGTDDLTTLPWTQDGDIRDLATNLQLVDGAANPYQDGILEAMEQAGIGPDEPVLLAGHSMGGMTAAAILGQGSPFDVTDVVTLGAPTAHVDGFPSGSHVLSLEQHGDVVPLLDGEDNPDSPEQVTVTFDAGAPADGGLEDHHDHDTYAVGAAAVDASDHPSVQDALGSLTGHGYLGDGDGVTVTSQVFQITRAPRAAGPGGVS
ncbi:hypothetical protein [Nocardioides sp. SYSU D00038]|uniref:hypothetical protein n=1 Tax=Nocardioides sp. SYSU D00038 TaxID=2812554 RepID=UPI00196836B9|nr:hypothetical protein [Nocardioides sp. SYSU D00038]